MVDTVNLTGNAVPARGGLPLTGARDESRGCRRAAPALRLGLAPMNEAPPDMTWQQDLKASARRVSAAVVGGLVTGVVVGGVVGRFAMFVLRVTSDPSLHGVKTDDGFIIGRFSAETLFLLLATAALGVLGGILYLGVRRWLPERQRAALAGVFGGSSEAPSSSVRTGSTSPVSSRYRSRWRCSSRSRRSTEWR